ncbi:MAG: DUF2191 domain-containing protein [Fimbriimonadaceae bacterium]
MKINLEIEDALFDEARMAAIQHRSTLRELVERGLRKELASLNQKTRVPIDLSKFVVTGSKLPEERSWEEIRDLAYGMEADDVHG